MAKQRKMNQRNGAKEQQTGTLLSKLSKPAILALALSTASAVFYSDNSYISPAQTGNASIQTQETSDNIIPQACSTQEKSPLEAKIQKYGKVCYETKSESGQRVYVVGIFHEVEGKEMPKMRIIQRLAREGSMQKYRIVEYLHIHNGAGPLFVEAAEHGYKYKPLPKDLSLADITTGKYSELFRKVQKGNDNALLELSARNQTALSAHFTNYLLSLAYNINIIGAENQELYETEVLLRKHKNPDYYNVRRKRSIFMFQEMIEYAVQNPETKPVLIVGDNHAEDIIKFLQTGLISSEGIGVTVIETYAASYEQYESLKRQEVMK